MLLALAVCACQSPLGETKAGAEYDYAAKVGSAVLLKSELKDVVPGNLEKRDSLRILNNYLEQWVKKQLVIQQAENSNLLNDTDIKRRLEDYKYALLAHEFQKKYVEENLSHEVSDEMLKEYYESHQPDFELKTNVLRAFLVKVPMNAEGKEKLKKWLMQSPTANLDELRSYCTKNASSYHLNQEEWLSFDKLVAGTPYFDLENPTQLLRSGNYFERTDGNFSYHLRVLDLSFQEETAPFDYVKDRVKNILIYKRKLKLLENLEKNMYEEAKKENAFEIRYFSK